MYENKEVWKFLNTEEISKKVKQQKNSKIWSIYLTMITPMSTVETLEECEKYFQC